MADGAPGVIRAGLVGRGIQGSRSPAMHMAEAAALGLRLSYVLFDLDVADADLGAVLQAAEAQGFAGLNVTYPFKQAVIPLLDELSPDAERLGAVNTVVLRGGRRVGHNTDWFGFGESFRRGLAGAALGQAVQVGAGGAGAAVAYALLKQGVGKLSLFDLDEARVEELAGALRPLFGRDRVAVGEDLKGALAAADGLVNATPMGMIGCPGTPAPKGFLHARLWVAEIVYFPLETELLAAAHALGCRTLDGGGMAVFQAAEAFRLFTEVAPDSERMLADFRRAVETPPAELSLHD